MERGAINGSSRTGSVGACRPVMSPAGRAPRRLRGRTVGQAIQPDRAEPRCRSSATFLLGTAVLPPSTIVRERERPCQELTGRSTSQLTGQSSADDLVTGSSVDWQGDDLGLSIWAVSGPAGFPVLRTAGCPRRRCHLNDHPPPAMRAVARWLELTGSQAFVVGTRAARLTTPIAEGHARRVRP